MINNKKVIFFYPSRAIGGVQTLFIRLIKKLYEEGVQVGYVDFCDGTIRKELCTLSDIDFINVDSIIINQNSIVVTSFNFINLAQLFFPKNDHFLFWFLSPYNLPILNLSNKLHLKLSNLKSIRKYYSGFSNYQKGLEKKSVYFMDSFCFNVNGAPTTNYEPYLPLYIDIAKSKYFYDVSKGSCNIAWVGRIDLSTKYHCIVFLIEKFETLKKDDLYKDVTLSIIGDGSGSEKIKKLCQLSRYSKSIKISKSIEYNRLHTYLLDNFDLIFAHGTTCLESALLGIPTICLDSSLSKFRDDYKFKWLFQRDIYDIGRTEYDSVFSQTGFSLPEVMDELKNNRKQLSKLCLEVVSEQYDQNLLYKKYLGALEHAGNNQLKLKSNTMTLIIDMIVHWKLFKSFLVVSMKKYFRNIHHRRS